MTPPHDRAAPEELVCRQLVEVVTDYLEDALPAAERARFEAHLAECPYCTEYVEQMRTVTRTLGGLAASEDALTPASRDALLDAFRGWRAGS
jgi:anti-sigma factor RsiW